MTGKKVGLIVLLVAIGLGYLWVYVDWGDAGLPITYELRPPRGEGAQTFQVAFGFPQAVEFETVEVTVAPDGAVPANQGVVAAEAPAEEPAAEDGEGGAAEGEAPEALSQQATQAGMSMFRLERDPELVERAKQRAAERGRPEPTFVRSYLMYGQRVRGMARPERPLRLEPGIVYRLEVQTVDGQRGTLDFATRALRSG
ncbi:MAG: hypothetical protein AAF078_06760 [Planctomycetota bacterium]